MTPYIFQPELDAFAQEIHVLTWFRDNLPKSTKKLIKMSRYVRPMLPMHIQRSLCDIIEDPRSLDPMKWMGAVIKEMTILPDIMKKLMEEGNHGMIMDGGDIYGFNLNTRPHWLQGAGGNWTDEQEGEIGNEAVKEWMIANRRQHFDGRFVLFDEFGFSGISRKGGWSIPKDEWEEKVKPLRDAERKHQKLVDEIAKYQ